MPHAVAKNETRTLEDLKDGNWYWIDKNLILEYAPRVGAMGITVYNFLAASVDKNQQCYPSQSYIAKCLGYSRATINKAIKLLEKNGLVTKDNKSRYSCVYHLNKIPRCRAEETQVSTIGNSAVNQRNINNISITKSINNNIDNNNFMNFNFYKPKNREELLAYDLARELNEINALPLYLSYANKYPETILRRILGEVKEVPAGSIRKSRGALFNYLVKQYAQKTNHNSGNQPRL